MTARLCPTCGAKVLGTEPACWDCGFNIQLAAFRPLEVAD